MNIYFYIFLCFLPFLFCIILFTPFLHLRFFTGFITALFVPAAVTIVMFFQIFLGSLIPELNLSNNLYLIRLFFKYLILNGILEETAKTILIIFIARKYNSIKGFFSVSLLCGLAFGCFESALYFLEHLQQFKNTNLSTPDFVYHIIFARFFSSNLIHTFCAGLCGLFIWSFKIKKYNFSPIIIAILMHALFNFFMYFTNGVRSFFIASVLFTAVECRIIYEKLKLSIW